MCKERLKLFSRVEKEVACEQGVYRGGCEKEAQGQQAQLSNRGYLLLLSTVTPLPDSLDGRWVPESLRSFFNAGLRGRILGREEPKVLEEDGSVEGTSANRLSEGTPGSGVQDARASWSVHEGGDGSQ